MIRQQAGFLGGPLYTTYKIATAIRRARDLQASTGRRVIPVFWLASEDHDFQEINHTYSLSETGEVRRLSFGWRESGRPVSDLPLTPELKRATERYLADCRDTLAGMDVSRLLAQEAGDSYCSWVARIFLRVFGAHGLVVVEPRILAPLAGEIFARAFSQVEEARGRMREVAAELRSAGWSVPLDPEQAGVPFRYSGGGARVRSHADPSLAREASARPEAFSSDAALRPVVQDALFPTVASILGPGEIAYQAMLRPLYELHGVPQPAVLPRLSMTLMTEQEEDLLGRCGLRASDALRSDLATLEILRAAVSPSERGLFEDLRSDIRTAMEKASAHAGESDPNLRITAQNAMEICLRAVTRLEQRSHRARLSRQGVSARALMTLRSALLPRGAPQERTYPLPFIVRRHGRRIIDALVEAAGASDPRHGVAVAGPP